jgi:hypothetical protein
MNHHTQLKRYFKYTYIFYFKKIIRARCWWLTPVIPATQETESRRITVQSQIVQETLSQKYPTQKRAGGVTLIVRAPAQQE